MIQYAVYCSGGPDYPDVIAGIFWEKAERFARDQSACDPDGRTYVVEREDTWEIAAEYCRGELRTDRPHPGTRRSRPADVVTVQGSGSDA
jgi:hypothetical protein